MQHWVKDQHNIRSDGGKKWRSSAARHDNDQDHAESTAVRPTEAGAEAEASTRVSRGSSCPVSRAPGAKNRERRTDRLRSVWVEGGGGPAPPLSGCLRDQLCGRPKTAGPTRIGTLAPRARARAQQRREPAGAGEMRASASSAGPPGCLPR